MKLPQPGPPKDFQPNRNRSLNKEMSVWTSQENVIFFLLVSFDPKFWLSLKTLCIFLTSQMQMLLILLLQQEINYLDLKSSVARQKRKKTPYIGNARVLERYHPGKRPGCMLLCQQNKHSDFALRLYNISNPINMS